MNPTSTREEEMIAMHAAGMSLRRIGEKFDLTGERVRQILQAEGVNTERRERVPATTEDMDSKIRMMIESGRDDGIQYTAAEIGEAMGITTTRASARIGALGLGGWVIYPRVDHKVRTYSNDDISAALRSVAKVLGTTRLSAKAYGSYRRMHPDNPLPSESLIVRRFPSWSDACVTAGLEPHEERPGGYARRFSDELLADTLADYIEDCIAASERPTARGYTSWARDNHRLSFSTIALNLGPRAWGKARAIGYSRLDERGEHE